MTISCPCCGGYDFECIDVDPNLDVRLYECEDCECQFTITEVVDIIKDGMIEDEEDKE